MLYLIMVLGLVLLVLLAVLKARFGDGASAKPGVYYPRKSLFTPAERFFLGAVEPYLPPGVRVFGKVRLEDILGVQAALERSELLAARNRIHRKHVDFLLVRTTDLAPVAGIELVEDSPEKADPPPRDALVDAAFASAGLPLLRIPAQKSYNPAEIRAKIASVTNTPFAPPKP